MIKAVIFDVDGVLLDSFDSNLESLQEFFKANGYRPMTRKDCKVFFYKPLWDVIIAVTGITDEEKVRKIWNSAKKFEWSKGRRPVLMTGAKNVVKSMSKKYKLGIVTSRIKINACEPPLDSMKPFFKVNISYEDTKNHKPHPEPLLLAAKKLGVEPHEAVYIGDSELDMKAAKAAGMRFILFSNKKIKGTDIWVKSFKDAQSAIFKMNNGD